MTYYQNFWLLLFKNFEASSEKTRKIVENLFHNVPERFAN